MTGQNKRKQGMRFPLRAALAFLMLLLGIGLLFRGRGGASFPADGSEETLSDRPAETACAVTPRPSPISSDEPALSQGPDGEQAPLGPASLPEPRPIVYDERSYQLVTDMVFAYRKQLSDRELIIAADVAALKAYDPRLGEAWGGIMDYWDYANERMELNFNALPDTLPQDDSLCLVVLGFQLLPEGGMSPEMQGRCELALEAARQYPNAYLAVTGGGTAFLNPDVTEAEVMAGWFLDHGIGEERLIREDRSSTTEENARNTLQILVSRYPQIKKLAIISSDYHLPLGCLLFTEASLLYGCENGEAPYAVVSNLALRGYGLHEYKNPAEQALYVWALADPQIG